MWSAIGGEMLTKLFTNASDTWGSGAGLRNKEREESQRDYLERERMGIQARVEGFKSAGLHPVLASSGASTNSPVSYVGSGSRPSGYQHVESGPRSNPQAEPPDPVYARINEANARRAEAEARLAEMQADAAVRSLANQPGNGNGVISSLPTETQNVSLGQGGVIPGARIKVNEILSSRGGKTIGNHPGATDINIPGIDMPVTFPSEALNERLEDMDLLKYIALIGLNKDKLYDLASRNIQGRADMLKGWLKRFGLGGNGRPHPRAQMHDPRRGYRTGGASASW